MLTWSLIVGFMLMISVVFGEPVPDKTIDHHESCEFWASIGECSKNPSYMINYCAPSCKKVEEETLAKIPDSFYDIIEHDIHGNEIDFHRFQGKVLYIVNVASYCGYTEENYAMFQKLQKYFVDGLEIILQPCNAFGSQEPGEVKDIVTFAEGKGFSGIILKKGEVNGERTSPLFRYLKQTTGRNRITW
jgi:glutathione peroxidase-family protein